MKVPAKRTFKFTPVAPGEWVQPIRKGYMMACCDCGLVHRMDFRIVKDKRGRSFIQFRAHREFEHSKDTVCSERQRRKKKN